MAYSLQEKKIIISQKRERDPKKECHEPLQGCKRSEAGEGEKLKIAAASSPKKGGEEREIHQRRRRRKKRKFVERMKRRKERITLKNMEGGSIKVRWKRERKVHTLEKCFILLGKGGDRKGKICLEEGKRALGKKIGWCGGKEKRKECVKRHI